jgi:hypothetical protein
VLGFGDVDQYLGKQLHTAWEFDTRYVPSGL